MTRLVFVDVDDTLLTPPYAAVRRVATFFGKKFPDEAAFLNRSAVNYHEAFPNLFSSSAEMWAIALLSLPFGHFRSQSAMPLDIERISEILADHRVYLISKNPPSFTRWRVQRLRQIFSARLGDRYIACGPILAKGQSKLSIMREIAAERKVALSDCLLVDDSVENLQEAAAAGIRCAIVRSSWNLGAIDALQKSFAHLQAIDSTGIADAIVSHISGTIDVDQLPHFIVPPLTPRNGMRLARTFLKRWWLYSEPLPKMAQIIPIARNPVTSFLYRDPHGPAYKRIQQLLDTPGAQSGTRILALSRHARPMLLPLTLRAQLDGLQGEEKLRLFRTTCRDLLQARGHRFVRDAMFHFTELNLDDEKARVLRSQRIQLAKSQYMQSQNVTQEAADTLAAQYADELLTSRSYLSCLFGEWALDTALGRVFKQIHVKKHPMVRELETDHFLFYAATHRSMLDSAVLWSILSHTGLSFPFAVGADKMKKVWFGKLGAKGGTFFLRRKFVDVIYAAIIAEHVFIMQKPGSALEVFLEGQRSRSGLTLPPKKGIASIVWDNMGPNSKVAIVPVSFTYNKLPESEKLIKERFDERQKIGALSLRETSDMKIRLSRRKSLYDNVRAAWRRLRSAKVSECYVHFAEPIVLNKAAPDASLQNHVNEAMRRINSATATLPSSVLCLYLLGADEGHTTFELAVEFLRFSKAVVGLYQLPAHLPSSLSTDNAEADVHAFIKLPFVNRKFKRAGMAENKVLCINELDIDRASYYKNNVLHFFVLPAILSCVLTELRSGRIEELHRCFDHTFTKLQDSYFLPSVASTRGFIDAFLQILVKQGLIAVANSQWVVNEQTSNAMLLRVLSRLGAELVHGDLPTLMDAIRRSSNRKDVHVASRLTALETTSHVQAKVVDLSTTQFYVRCEAEAQLGDHVEFSAEGATAALSGIIVRVDADGVAVQHHQEQRLGMATASAEDLTGKATFKREQMAAGVIKNLSPSGAFIATTLRLKVGSHLACSLGHQDNAFVVQGRVARITEAGVGVHFEGLSEEGKARVVLLSVGTADLSAH